MAQCDFKHFEANAWIVPKTQTPAIAYKLLVAHMNVLLFGKLLKKLDL
jgi:hypothetical protein